MALGAGVRRRLHAYLTAPDPGARALAGVLRPVFALSFLAQGLFALALASTLAALGGRPATPPSAVLPVAAAGAALSALAAIGATAMATRAAASRGRHVADERSVPGRDDAGAARELVLRRLRLSALRSALLGGTLASTALWFAALAWLGGVGAAGSVAPLAPAAFGYLIGTAQMGGLARAVRLPDATPPPRDAAPDPLPDPTR